MVVSCIRDVLSRVTDKWSLWALSEVTADGPLGFSRLLERVEGVSQKSLTVTLRGLERDGLEIELGLSATRKLFGFDGGISLSACRK